MPRSIRDVIQLASQEQDPAASLDHLLRGVLELTESRSIRAYFLELRHSAYVLRMEIVRGTTQHAPIAQPSIACSADGSPRSYVEASIRAKDFVLSPLLSEPNKHVYGMAVPIVRGSSCLGAIAIESYGIRQFSEKDRQTTETAASVVVSIIEKRFALDLLREAQRPIDFYQPLGAFLEEML